MQKNLFFAAVAVVCVSLFSSCGTCKKDEAAKPTTEQAPVEAPKAEETKDVAQAEAAPAQTAQAEAAPVAEATPAPATEQKA